MAELYEVWAVDSNGHRVRRQATRMTEKQAVKALDRLKDQTFGPQVDGFKAYKHQG